MTIDKTQAVAFLVALGFAKAPEWDDDKLKERLDKVPTKVEEEEVPEGFEDLYKALVDSDADEPIEFGKAKGKKSKKTAVKKEPKPAAKKADAPAKDDTPPMQTKKTAVKKEPKPAAKKADAPAKAKKESTPAKTVERDAFGSKVGTISAKINAVLGEEWDDEANLASEAGITLDQARGRLYYAQQEGLIECRRLVQYRLVKKSKK